MPISSSKKLFYARHQSIIGRKSFVIGFVTLLLIGIVILKQDVTGVYKCKISKPVSVSVVWDQSSSSGGSDGDGGLVNDLDRNRHKVMGFVGIQTGFASAGKRKSLRKTWLPSDQRGFQRLEESTGLAFRFIIGKTRDT